MKALLVLPPTIPDIEKVLGFTSPPLGLAYLASVARENGHKVKIIDSLAEGISFEELEKSIREYDPEVVGITASTMMIPDAYRVAQISKKINPNIINIIGGPHVTFVPELTLKESKDIDIVVRGEGEEIFRQLLDTLEKRKSLSDVKGITYREDNKIKSNVPMPLIKDIDSIPIPAFDLLPMEKYRFNKRQFGVVITSRGCPFKCIFCSSSLQFGKRWRAHSVDRVIEELKILYHHFNVREIEFLDDTFTLSKRRAQQISEAIINEGLDISWSASSRVNIFDLKTGISMKKSGAHTIYFGIESGSEETLKFIKKGITLEQSITAIKTAKKARLKILGSFIIGFPYEKESDMRKTISFAKSLDIDYAQFTIATPFPGTELWYIAVSKNLLLSRNWRDYTATKVVMKNIYVSADKIQHLFEWAYISFYLSPKRLIKDIFKEKGILTRKALKALPKVLAYKKTGS